MIFDIYNPRNGGFASATWAAGREVAPRSTSPDRHCRHRFFKPEAEFYIFDDVRYDAFGSELQPYFVDSEEGA
jgi:hypothetical protein